MTVLLVEDDVKIRQRLALVLRAANYEVHETDSIAGALERIGDKDLEAVVLDLRLRNGHGRAVVDKLRATRDDVPVVILSAYPTEVLLEFPVVAILKKPTKPSELKSAVSAARRTADDLHALRRSTNKLRALNQ